MKKREASIFGIYSIDRYTVAVAGGMVTSGEIAGLDLPPVYPYYMSTNKDDWGYHKADAVSFETLKKGLKTGRWALL